MNFEQPQQKEEQMKHEDRLMGIIQDAQAFTTEELEMLKEFVSSSSAQEQLSPEKLDQILEADEKFGATNRILIAARAWLDNKK